MKKLKKIVLLGLCGAVMATSVPYNYTNNINIQAAENVLTVTPKKSTKFFVNQAIDVNQFDFSLNKSVINTDKITISPFVFTTSGSKEITITYDSGNGVYQQKLNIEVQDVTAEHLELASNDITLVKDQTITVASLPDVYMYYNDGTKKIVTDYTTNIDWEKGILEISANGLSITEHVNIIDSQISYIQINAKKSVVPADYIFTTADFDVTAYFTNGMSMLINDYQIQPYTLVDGGETVITIKYLTVTSSFIVKGTAPLNTPTPTATLAPNVTEAPYDNPLGITPIPSATPIINPSISSAATTVPTETNIEVTPTKEIPTINSELPFYNLSENAGSVYYSNHSIKVTCNNILNGKYQLINSNADISNTKWINFESEIIISTESNSVQTLYIQYTSENGDITHIKSKNFLIDTVAPSCNISKKTYTKNIAIKCKDDCSGISKIILSGKSIKNNYKLKKEGTYTLKVTDFCGNTYSIRFELKKPAKKLTVSYKAISSKVIKFNAKVSGTTRNVKWSVSNPKIASISKTGKFVAIHKGTCYITAKIDKLKIKKKIVIQESGNTTSAYVY